MHELGVLYQVVKTVNRIAEENHIHKVKYITLDVGNPQDLSPIILQSYFR